MAIISTLEQLARAASHLVDVGNPTELYLTVRVVVTVTRLVAPAFKHVGSSVDLRPRIENHHSLRLLWLVVRVLRITLADLL